MDRLGPFFARSLSGDQGTQFIQTAWHDPTQITETINAGYRLPLQVDNWDVALWEFTKAGSASEDLAPRLGDLALPVVGAAGDDDRIIPTELSRQLATEIPGASWALFPACGHVPHEECPDLFMDAIEPFIQELKNTD
jgi:pimeloyl-ACP methyl ester carboxylesterase